MRYMKVREKTIREMVKVEFDYPNRANIKEIWYFVEG